MRLPPTVAAFLLLALELPSQVPIPAGTGSPGSTVEAAPTAAAPKLADPVAIVGVAVVDVVAGRLVPGQTILVREGRIEALGAAAEIVVPAGVATLDGRGLIALPGLIDAHVHVPDAQGFGALMVAHGVVAARDMGGVTALSIEAGARYEDGRWLGPKLLTAGAILDGSPPVWPMSIVVETEEAARAAVERLAEAGVDAIKVYNRLKPEVYAAIVVAAKARKLPVVGHVPTALTITDAARAGQATVDHLLGWDRAFARLLGMAPKDGPVTGDVAAAWTKVEELPADALATLIEEVRAAGVVQVPTLVVLDRIRRIDDPALAADPRLALVSPFVKGLWKNNGYRLMSRRVQTTFPAMQRFVGRLAKAGVTILAGTDLANPYLIPGAALHDELLLLEGAGLSRAAVLRAATSEAARVLGLERDLGTLATGKLASFVLLRGNPLDDLANTARLDSVVLRGRVLRRAELDAILDGERARHAAAAEAAVSPPAEAPPAAKILARGSFVETLDGRPQGREDFGISEDADGFTLEASRHPEGIIVVETRSTVRATKDRRVVSGTFERDGTPKLRARYQVLEAELVGEAEREGLPPLTQRLPHKIPSLLGGPSPAAEWFALGGSGLKPGETKPYFGTDFGVATWEWRQIRRLVTREPDAEVDVPGFGKVLCRVYTSKAKTADGPVVTTAWTDADGLPYRIVSKTVVGTVEILRKAP